MDNGQRAEPPALDPKVVADLCKAIFLYARGGDFRPMPQGDLLWLSSKLLGLGRYNGHYSFLDDWRSIMLRHGLDPATGERIHKVAFEFAVYSLVAKNEHRHEVKLAKRSKGRTQESEPAGEQGAKPPELKPFDPRSLYRPPAPVPARLAAPPSGSMWDENYQPSPSEISEKPPEPAPSKIESVAKATSESDFFKQRYPWAH